MFAKKIHLAIQCLAALMLVSQMTLADEILDQARALMEQNNAAGALELLDPLIPEREGTPEFDYLFGIAALDSGRVTEAVFALERVLAIQPGNDLARAEIARAYFLLGETETAKQEFEKVRESEQAPPAARETIEQYLSVLDRAAAGDSDTLVSGWVDFAFGFDTNINSGTDQSQVALPILGNVQFRLIDNATGQDHAFTQFGGGVNASHKIAEKVRLVGGLRGFSRQTDEPFSTRDVYGYAGLATEHGRHRFTVAGTAENYAVDSDTLRNVFGGFGQWTYALDEASRVNLSVQGSSIEYINLPNRDVDRYVISAGYIRALDRPSQPYIYAGVYGGVEDEKNSAFPQFGHDLYGGRIGGSLEVMTRTRAFANFAVEQRDYNGPDTIFLTTRDDTQIIASAGLEYGIRQNWKVVPEISYINNDSNIPLSDFDRIVASLRVRYTF